MKTITTHEATTSQDGVLFKRVLGKAGLAIVYGAFIIAHVGAIREEFRLSLALLVLFESVMCCMVIVRRDQTEVDYTPLAIIAGLLGSFMGLFFRPVEGAGDLFIGQSLQVLSVLLSIGAAFSLGRSFGLIPANRGIKTGGLYQLVRHPFYFSYLIGSIGYLVNNQSFRNAVVIVAGVLFQAIRIRYEERLLLKTPAYQEYAAGVRWHLVPGVW